MNLEWLRQMIEEFMNINMQLWLPFIIIMTFIFFGLIINYIMVYNSPLITKTLVTHGFISEENAKGQKKDNHFHNTDTVDSYYDIERAWPEDEDDWIGKHFLFIPNNKINTLEKKFNKLIIWYNGYISSGVEYRVKNLPKGWYKRVLGKKNVRNYNGSFIISNLMVKTLNLTSLSINGREKERFILTYLFDNGSKFVQELSHADFINDMVYRKFPYNKAFLKTCEMIELL